MEDMEDDDFNVSMGDEEFGVNNSTFLSVTSMESRNSFEVDVGDLEDASKSTPKKGFKKPSAPSRSKKPAKEPSDVFARCVICGQYLKTSRGFNQHQKNHKWKDAASRIPNVDDFIEFCKEKIPELIENLTKEFDIAAGEPGHFHSPKYVCTLKEMKENMGGEKWSAFEKCLLKILTQVFSSADAKKALPSALRPELEVNLLKMFADKSFREELWSTFCHVNSCDEEVGWNILFPLAKKISDLAFIHVCLDVCSVMSGDKSAAGRPNCKDDFSERLAIQTLHHVAGSALRSHFRAAFQHPMNSHIQNVKLCILAKFARIGSPPVINEKDPQYWTSRINRKSLFFLHDSAMPFFVELAKVLQALETSEGDLIHDRVMEAVCGNTLILWDSIVEDFLSEDESFRFMSKINKSITNTYGRGIVNRRMNAGVKSGQGNKTQLSIGHRAKLVGKVTQCPSTS